MSNVIVGKQIPLFRMKTLLIGLRVEIQGMRMTRGRSCYAIVKREFGLKGNKESVYAQFCLVYNDAVMAYNDAEAKLIDSQLASLGMEA